MERRLNIFDRLVNELDKGVRTAFGPAPKAERANPAAEIEDTELSRSDRDLATRFMRINHAGEICAQGLYQGQALTARLPKVRKKMEQAAKDLDFLQAARHRDEMYELQKLMKEKYG